jgi:hypothetical protein
VHNATPIGAWRVYGKVHNTVLIGHDANGSWRDPVAYWMLFYGAYGIHDVSWQTFPYGSPSTQRRVPMAAFTARSPSWARCSTGHRLGLSLRSRVKRRLHAVRAQIIRGTHARPLAPPVLRLRSLFGSAMTHQFIEFANRFLTGSGTPTCRQIRHNRARLRQPHVREAALEQRRTGESYGIPDELLTPVEWDLYALSR